MYLQPDAPDPVLPNDLVLSIVSAHVPSARRVCAVDESGGEARTYLIDDAVILKVQRPPQLRPLTSLEKEVYILERLAEQPDDLRVSTPRVLGHGRTPAGTGYSVLTRMHGTALRGVDLRADQRRTTLQELGRNLRRLHRLPFEPVIASGLVPGDLSFMDVMTRLAEPLLDRARELRDRGGVWDFPLSIERIAGRALSSLGPALERALLHSNP